MVDPKRVAIMGSSFGGYLAVSGVAHEPELYRCAVTVAGVFDWEQMIREAKYDRFTDAEYNYLIRGLGDPAKQKDRFTAMSPINFVPNIRVPVFVAHGKEDYVVPITQSKHLISAFKDNHVVYESMLASEEGHGMHYLKDEVVLYDRIAAFLAKYLAPAAPAPPATDR